MSINYQQLMSPESLSESMLIEILKSRCIELPNVKDLKKSDLIEMFMRVALPLPQRQYNEAKLLGKKLNDLRVTRKISISTEKEQALYKSIVSSQSDSFTKSNYRKLRAPSEDVSLSPKKQQLSNISEEKNNLPENGLKRKFNDKEISAQTEGKKRQKITWP